jgi:hypothetical protein
LYAAPEFVSARSAAPAADGARPSAVQELDALINKKLSNPWKKHGNIPL